MQAVIEMTAGDLSELLNVTPRRVRQLWEEGRLKKTARGQFDATFAITSAAGAAWLGQDRRRSVQAEVVAAVGWLAGFTVGRSGIPITAADLAAWRSACERWSISADQATGLLISAAALMGQSAPEFKA